MKEGIELEASRLYLSPPHMSGMEMDYIKAAFDTNWIAPLGPNVDAFEKELSSYIGVGGSLALSSGTAGIHLALRYLDVQPGDYVFCSDLTFSGSCNPIMYQHANPVFIDSEPESWNMSPGALEEALQWAKKNGKLPKAVIIVDLYGQSADYDKLLPICEKHMVPIIEDAAEALGASYKDRKCGSFGNMGVFSFNGNKIITTSGGGMVVSNSLETLNKMRFWATQAREPLRHYEHKEYGYNYRLSNICAGIGLGQLKVLDTRIGAKKKVFVNYMRSFSDIPIAMMPISESGEPNYWLSVITLNEEADVCPEDIIAALDRENIESRPVWKPMHMQPVFQDCNFFSHTMLGSVSQKVFEKGVCLPSGSAMTEAEQDKVIRIIKSCFGERSL